MNSVKKVGRTKKEYRTLFEITRTFNQFGVGEKVNRCIWRRPDCYWTITKVKPSNLDPFMKARGRIWGILTWRGVTEIKEKQIKSINKKQWMLYQKSWVDQFQDAEKWIQNQHLIGGSLPMPIVLQDPTKIPIIEKRFETIYADEPKYEEALKKSKQLDQKILFKDPENPELLFYYPLKKNSRGPNV